LIEQEINNDQDVCTAQYKRTYSFETRVDCEQVRKVHRVASFGGITHNCRDRLAYMPQSAGRVSVQTAAGIGDSAQKLRERRRVIRKTLRGVLTDRIARRRTRTAKLLNSNSFIGTNSRLESSERLVKNFIIILKLRSSLSSNLVEE
jgi:hypothetical protein